MTDERKDDRASSEGRHSTQDAEAMSQQDSTVGNTAMGASGLMGIAMVALICIVLVVGYFMKSRIEALESQQYGSPEIVIVDFGELSTLYPLSADEEDIRRMVVRVDAVIQSLKDSGLVVLDRNSVAAAPDDLYVDSELIFEQAGINLDDWGDGENISSSSSPESQSSDSLLDGVSEMPGGDDA